MGGAGSKPRKRKSRRKTIRQKSAKKYLFKIILCESLFMILFLKNTFLFFWVSGGEKRANSATHTYNISRLGPLFSSEMGGGQQIPLLHRRIHADI